jgi:rhodanese-related sulfurtransferase
MDPTPLDIALADYVSLRESGAPITLVDCREPWEWELVRLPGAVLMPLGELPVLMDDLPKDREVIVYCHHGVRSRYAAHHLRESGWRARSLAGGIDRYARIADQSLPLY